MALYRGLIYSLYFHIHAISWHSLVTAVTRRKAGRPAFESVQDRGHFSLQRFGDLLILPAYLPH